MSGNLSEQRPRLLDLFCGAGGAATGYHRAGFEVVGVDYKRQPHYPYRFVRGDALEYLQNTDFLDAHEIVAIHASPPCQHYSDLAYRNGNADAHPDLIGPVRELLEATGLPYVIENVEGAPLNNPALICGTELGLFHDGYRLRRHRLFETNWRLHVERCACRGAHLFPVLDVSGGGPSHAPRLDGAGGRTYKGTADQVRAIMGMPWATKAECNEAVPPAYTELIGYQLLAQLVLARAA